MFYDFKSDNYEEESHWPRKRLRCDAVPNPSNYKSNKPTTEVTPILLETEPKTSDTDEDHRPHLSTPTFVTVPELPSTTKERA
ncbi:hypothetical protein QE152_g38732 [Popillia japonica]|uniref:Uncharacterized protein n=1 Tax=Popillia japonica TaxID=7064 RepID=A0AAW1HW27_POPJA